MFQNVIFYVNFIIIYKFINEYKLSSRNYVYKYMIYTYIIYIYMCVCVCVIMKKMCPAGYHHNGFVETHVLGHMMYGAQVHEFPQSHYGDNGEDTFFSRLHLYYAYLTSVRFEYSAYRESLK